MKIFGLYLFARDLRLKINTKNSLSVF